MPWVVSEPRPRETRRSPRRAATAVPAQEATPTPARGREKGGGPFDAGYERPDYPALDPYVRATGDRSRGWTLRANQWHTQEVLGTIRERAKEAHARGLCPACGRRKEECGQWNRRMG